MLTELQRRIARLVLSAGVDPDLALAGGGALISLGLVRRSTIDLDFFTTRPGIEDTVDNVVSVLEQAGISVERQRVAPTFARLIVSEGTERCRVDLAQDARLWPVEEGPLGPTINAEELAADKMLALFTRAEARDYVDVYFLAQRFPERRLLHLASEKDEGFDNVVFVQMLGVMSRLDREEFEVDDATMARIESFIERWRDELGGSAP